MSPLGQRIRSVRGSKTQAEFAEIMGVTQGVISTIESGRTEPNMTFLMKMNELFGTDLGWLITGDGGAVKDTGADYGMDTDVTRLARQLQEHPRLIPIIKSLVSVDDKLLRDAETLAGLLGVPVEIAALCVALKKQHT